MLPISRRPLTHRLLSPLFFTALAVVVVLSLSGSSLAQTRSARSAGAKAVATSNEKESDAPTFGEYKGARIGMSDVEARQKLGEPKTKMERMDLYDFSEKESAMVYYDESRKVTAIVINYTGAGSGAPAPQAVIGKEIEAKPDGSMHDLVQYQKAGFWVSYSRSAGDAAVVTVMIQKIQ